MLALTKQERARLEARGPSDSRGPALAAMGIRCMKRNIHSGSSFDDFLAEEGILESADTVAHKRVLAWQIRQAMKQRRVGKAELARRMGTSRAALDRLLDPDNPGVTLATLGRAAAALGKELRLELTERRSARKSAGAGCGLR